MNFLVHADLREKKKITYSKAQLWRLTKLPSDDPRKFPAPVKGLGPENVWAEPDVDAYIARRVAAAGARETEAA